MEYEILQKTCACSGIRSCLLCNPQSCNQTASDTLVSWYCPQCGKLFDGDISTNISKMTNTKNSSWRAFHENELLSSLQVDGVEVLTDFITPEEEMFLAGAIDKHEWK